jgi:hypothetical protein
VYLAAGHHFYDSTAFATAAAIVVGLLTAVVTVWATRLGASTKRSLYYVLLSDTPLLTRRHALSEKLKVTYDSRTVESPRIVTIRLVSRGRADIAREAFDRGQPLILDLGTPIVDLVKVETSPSDRPDPEWTLRGSELLVGPSHFGRRQTTEFSLLIDGREPSIVAPKQTLIDVRVEHGDGATVRQSRIIRVLLWIAGLGALVAIVGLAADQLPVFAPGAAVAFAGIFTVLAIADRVPEWRNSKWYPTGLER